MNRFLFNKTGLRSHPSVSDITPLHLGGAHSIDYQYEI